jgi:Protein of unknown function (DUF2919)
MLSRVNRSLLGSQCVSPMALKYHLACYDDNFCLKPPVLLWIALVFLSRGVMLPLLVGVMSMTGLSPDAKGMLQGLMSLPSVPSSIIGAAVLLAALRRAPKASGVMRWIWRHGLVLLAIAAVGDAVTSLATAPIVRGTTSDTTSLTVWAPVLAATYDVYFLAYLLSVRRVRDTFAQFPLPLTAGSPGPASS